MSKKGKIPVGLDLEYQGTGGQRSKHFPESGPSKSRQQPIPIGVPLDYDGTLNSGYQASTPALPMARNHSTRASSSNRKENGSLKANASPFSVGAPATKKIQKGPTPSKLLAVSGDAFYQAKAAGSSTRAKKTSTIQPEDLPSPTDHAAQSFRNRTRSKGVEQEIIAVGSDESEEEVEDVGNVTEVKVTENGRASMVPLGAYRRSYHMTGNTTPETPKSVHQTESKHPAKARAVSGKGTTPSNRDPSAKHLSKLKRLYIDGHCIDEKVAHGLVLAPATRKLCVQRKIQGEANGDLEIPLEPPIKYVVVEKDNQVSGLIIHGQVSERIRKDWYSTVSSIRDDSVLPGRQRFLICLELQSPIHKSNMKTALELIKYDSVVPSAIEPAFTEHLGVFAQEKEAAQGATGTVGRQSPLPSYQPSRNSTRPLPRRRTRNDPAQAVPDGPIQTRIQPERSARTASRNIESEQLVKKAEPPEYPDLIMREWPPDGRTEVIITQGDFYRLEEAEYLNDTLIEFGLKHHWFAMPEETNGTTQAFTRNDIHVFNSFFYKKLSVRNRPGYKDSNPEGPSWPAYETVRKWTNKVDVFNKKMLIIPINENLHWYLAVILNPGAILKKTGTSNSSNSSTQIVDLQEIRAKKEELLAKQLEEEKQREDVAQKRALTKDAQKAEENSVDPIDMIGGQVLDDALDDHSSDEVEDLPDQVSGSESLPEGKTRSWNQQPVPMPPPPQPIPLSPPPEFVPQDISKSTRRGPIIPPPPKPRTEFAPGEPVIMTFDSLGPVHSPVGKILNKWLVYEALDKRKDETRLTENDWDAHTPAAYKGIRVPGQDNFADCGLYVVHYAIQLMKDQGELRSSIYQNLPVRSQEDRDKLRDIWDANDMLKKREEWKKTITDLPRSKSGAKSEVAKDSAIKGNQSSVTGSTNALGKEPGQEDSDASGGIAGTPNQAVVLSAAAAPIPSASAAPLTEGASNSPIATPRTSPAKRTIPISPIASQDAPVNKRRKIAQEDCLGHDVVAGLGSETSQGYSYVQPEDMQLDEPVGSQSRSPQPPSTPGQLILALASPESSNEQPPELSSISAVTDGLREVKVTESSVPHLPGSSGRPSMGSPISHRPVTSVVAPEFAGELDGMYPISKTARKETPRDRLRKDNNAEPRRMSNAECTSVIGKKLKKNTGQVTACVEPKLNREEFEREVAADFGDWILQPLDQNPVMQFRDTIFAPFRLAHEAEDYHSLELLRDVVKGHNSGSDDMLNARMEWTAPVAEEVNSVSDGSETE
ncbi:hypothetical protein NliqN6_2839 [Naganishia liquefaciens]|uniref:Ubiquitin-like protease family profile domain-containing protein n=1 Tax=Naganishia liquefaciens TaxID=104408 RepID=A0A8H3TSM7_9TREE|nr:hypothetical protein NliqN6_2839 [Naganishia liquefaciens]